jgi:hypothetical protein
MKITKKLAERVELLLQQLGYKIRYEKGNFRGGVCVLEDQKLIVINKFYPFESRVTTLVDVLANTTVAPEDLEADDYAWIQELKNKQLSLVS